MNSREMRGREGNINSFCVDYRTGAKLSVLSKMPVTVELMKIF